MVSFWFSFIIAMDHGSWLVSIAHWNQSHIVAIFPLKKWFCCCVGDWTLYSEWTWPFCRKWAKKKSTFCPFLLFYLMNEVHHSQSPIGFYIPDIFLWIVAVPFQCLFCVHLPAKTWIFYCSELFELHKVTMEPKFENILFAKELRHSLLVFLICSIVLLLLSMPPPNAVIEWRFIELLITSINECFLEESILSNM